MPVYKDNSLPPVKLSKREKQVLMMVLDGKPTTDIAHRLVLSTHTVDQYRKSIGRKLNTTNPLGWLKLAGRFGWVNVHEWVARPMFSISRPPEPTLTSRLMAAWDKIFCKKWQV